jgi:ribonuclease P protein component
LNSGNRNIYYIKPRMTGLFSVFRIMNPIKGNQFPKAEHLKSRKQIEELFAGGKSFFIHPVKVYWKIINQQDGLTGDVRVGVSASKRNFKKAVDRNRVKRLLREAYRLNKQDLVQLFLAKNVSLQVFFIYVDKTLPTFETLETKMKNCIKKLQKIGEEAP